MPNLHGRFHLKWLFIWLQGSDNKIEILRNLSTCRFRMYSIVNIVLQELVRAYPEEVSHMPEALPLFLGDPLTNYERIEVYNF